MGPQLGAAQATKTPGGKARAPGCSGCARGGRAGARPEARLCCWAAMPSTVSRAARIVLPACCVGLRAGAQQQRSRPERSGGAALAHTARERERVTPRKASAHRWAAGCRSRRASVTCVCAAATRQPALARQRCASPRPYAGSDSPQATVQLGAGGRAVSFSNPASCRAVRATNDGQVTWIMKKPTRLRRWHPRTRRPRRQ